MLRDITLGQFYPGQSIIHKIDARVKIFATFVYIFSLFLIKDFYGYIPILSFLIMCIGLSRVPITFMLKGLKPIFLIIILTFMINMFMTSGKVIFEFWFLKVTEEGLRQATFMGSRLILLIIGSSLLTLATKPIHLTDGIEKILNPFRKIGVPAHELAMMMTIALRFIPTLLEETDKIMKAQMARGADFESGNIINRAKAMIPLLVPLFVSAFRIAQDLAMAMEARCYQGGDNRTRMTTMKYGKRDIFSIFIVILYIVIIIGQRML